MWLTRNKKKMNKLSARFQTIITHVCIQWDAYVHFMDMIDLRLESKIKKTVFTIEFLSKKIATNPDAHLPVEKKWIQIHSTLFGSISKWKTAMITYIWYKKLWKYIAFEFVRFYALLLPACPSFHHTCCRAYRWKCHLIIEIFIDVIFTNIIQTRLNLFNSIWNSSFTDRWVIFYNFCYEKDQLLYSVFFWWFA